MKITQAERDAWAGKKDTMVFFTTHGWEAHYFCLVFCAPTKNAAVNAAIRAERKEKR